LGKNCTFFTKNQAFSCENLGFFIVFSKIAEFGPKKPLILRLLNQLCSHILTKEVLFLYFLERLI